MKIKHATEQFVEDYVQKGFAMDGNIDMGGNDILSVGELKLSQLIGDAGKVRWNADDQCVEYDTGTDNVAIQVGQELVVRARNSTGATILNGSAVYVSGVLGNRPRVSLAQADDMDSATKMIGVSTHDIPNNSDGFITIFGLVRDINTSDFEEGDLLWLSPTSAGNLTNVKPENEYDFCIRIGYVTRSGPDSGAILVEPQICGSALGNGILMSTSKEEALSIIGAEPANLVQNIEVSSLDVKSVNIFDASSYKHAIIKMAISADTIYGLFTALVVTDGANVSFTTDETTTIGDLSLLDINMQISSGNLAVLFNNGTAVNLDIIIKTEIF